MTLNFSFPYLLNVGITSMCQCARFNVVLDFKPRALSMPSKHSADRAAASGLSLGTGESGSSHYVDQAGLEHTEIILLLPPKCWD